MTTITMFPAEDGDSFLISHECHLGNTSILIDGGYAATYDKFLRPVLQSLASVGNHLELLIATHIDADHISGVLKLLKGNGPSSSPRVIRIRRVWHNSLRSLTLQPSSRTPVSAGDVQLLTELRDRGYVAPTKALESDISALQGSSLAKLLAVGGYLWNEGDGTQSICAPFSFTVNPEVSVAVLGPTEDRLRQLRDWWIKEIRSLGVAGAVKKTELMEDVFEFLCSYEPSVSMAPPTEISAGLAADRSLDEIYIPDTSPTNGSSISCMVTAGKHKLLFLGDSIAEDIEEALCKKLKGPPPWLFDAIKISHHGSFRNTSPTLLQMIDSPRFLISTNGDKHGHPDFAVLRAIVDRPVAFKRHLFFTCTTPSSHRLGNHISSSPAGFAIHDKNDSAIAIILSE